MPGSRRLTCHLSLSCNGCYPPSTAGGRPVWVVPGPGNSRSQGAAPRDVRPLLRPPPRCCVVRGASPGRRCMGARISQSSSQLNSCPDDPSLSAGWAPPPSQASQLVGVVARTGGDPVIAATGDLAGTSGETGCDESNAGPGGYQWPFVPEPGRTWADSGAGTCHRGGGDLAPAAAPVGMAGVVVGSRVDLVGSASADVDVAGYRCSVMMRRSARTR
jgi:hypothetical protein